MPTFNKDNIKDVLRPIVKKVVELNNKKIDLGKNTLDIFSAVIESSIKGLTIQEWEYQEEQRQKQKTLQNQIGEKKKKILGTIHGVEDLGVGSVIDLKGNGWIAEVKNKHNTTKGNHKVAVYEDLKSQLGNDENTIAYYVEILPKNGKSYDEPFVPSDNKKHSTLPKDERIRRIDGKTFYAKVTGNPNALRELYAMLPVAIAEIMEEDYGQKSNTSSQLLDFKQFERIYGKQ